MIVLNAPFLDENRLSKVFDNKTTSYKYFWALSILNVFKEKKMECLRMNDIIIDMVALAWHIINHDGSNIGGVDSLPSIIQKLRMLTKLEHAADEAIVKEVLLRKMSDKNVRHVLYRLCINVPYRFLSPWITYKSDEDTIRRSRRYQNGCPYALMPILESNDLNIDNKVNRLVLNPEWSDYLYKNEPILTELIKSSLNQYMQRWNNDDGNSHIKQLYLAS